MFLKCSRRACPCGSFLWWGVGKIVGDKGVKLNFLRVRFVYICRRKARKCGGLDVEAAGRQAEVQKGREREADWTLKWLGGRLKSKRSEKKRWIGR